LRASRRTAAGEIVPVSILRDAVLRTAPQDEVCGCIPSHRSDWFHGIDRLGRTVRPSPRSFPAALTGDNLASCAIVTSSTDQPASSTRVCGNIARLPAVEFLGAMGFPVKRPKPTRSSCRPQPSQSNLGLGLRADFSKSGKTLKDLGQPPAIIRDCAHICARRTP
jgi:hypothetical protein